MTEDPALLGSQKETGDGGRLLLLVRWSGALQEVAGGPGSGSGLLDWVSGERGGDLGDGRISGQK